ncbi:MAG: FixH family protein [Magnetococcales bacterium]|nr:FixH family protein [Magnetococcales bacterium]
MVNVPSSETPAKRFRISPWPLGIIVFFLIVFIANGVMIYYASRSWNGLVTEDHYRKGIAFDEVVQAQTAQDALGWQGSLEAAGLITGQPGRLLFRLTTSNGEPLPQAQVSGVLFRPTQAGFDLPLTLTETDPGLYVVRIEPPFPGAWDVKLLAVTPAGEYRFAERIHIPPSSSDKGA